MSQIYNGLEFETELLAQWAAFFDLAGWEWDRGVAPVDSWKPDYKVCFPCTHSECAGSHTIYVSVLPVSTLNNVKGHPALAWAYSVQNSRGERVADAGALFGNSPQATAWEMSHGAGGGTENIYNWADNASRLWVEAGILVRGL